MEKVRSIRQATSEDIEAIRQLALKVFPATYESILSSAQSDYMMEMMYSEESLRSQMEEQGHVFFICDGRGYASFRHIEKQEIGEKCNRKQDTPPKNTGEHNNWKQEDCRQEDSVELYHLEKLYVLPGQQGNGLGRELFETVVAAIRNVCPGPFRIELNVNRYNRAVSFYEHIGMHRDRTGDFPIGNGYYMNDYIMAIEFR